MVWGPAKVHIATLYRNPPEDGSRRRPALSPPAHPQPRPAQADRRRTIGSAGNGAKRFGGSAERGARTPLVRARGYFFEVGIGRLAGTQVGDYRCWEFKQISFSEE